ncbi:MAG TPA: hypothetical protein VF278_06620, partial [Pirellulales bacterium]
MRVQTLCLLTILALAASSARATHRDPKVERVVSRGLDWLANSRSRLGHWAANEGRYPTAMT